jgi:hypothetical protein
MPNPRLEKPAETVAPSAPPSRRRAPLALLLASLVLLVAGVAAACPVEEARLRYGVEIVGEGQSWDPLAMQAVLEALSRLPPHVVRDLGSPFYGRLHILANGDGHTLSGQRPYSYGANFYSNNDARNELVLFPSQGRRTVLHELGHAYQMRLTPPGRYAWVFFQQEMRDFTQATGWRLLSSDAEIAAAHDQTELQFAYDGQQVWSYLSHPDPLEDYANSFALFFDDPGELAALSPVRYDWFLRHVATDER